MPPQPRLQGEDRPTLATRALLLRAPLPVQREPLLRRLGRVVRPEDPLALWALDHIVTVRAHVLP